ncbi:MAG: formylglycine-generating enzyme family protein [Candidatus Contendobacter sp.]|nr:formylglycine-generating enzyme family protein [Candidatus Contendobacter sp.]
MRSVTPLTTPADAALPLLENVWDHLDEFTPPSVPSQPNATETEASSQPQSQPRSQPSTPLLKRSPQSAVTYLKKAAPSQRNSIPVDHLSEAPTSAPVPTDRSEPNPSLRPAVVESAGPVRSIHWTRVLLTIFAISGLSGTGILAYEYFKTFQEQRQQEIAAQQHQEAAQRGEEEAQRREAEIAGHIDQARRAIINKNWTLADHYLNRAATLNPGHQDIAAVRAELLAAQQPSANTKTRTDPITGLELGWVEGGCFNMGSPATERDRNNDETSHQVCVKGFWIGKTEITNNQYRRFKPGHNSGVFQGRSLNGDVQPAVNVNWDDAIAFAEWLSWEAGAGKRFRLPTEAEWERAARSGAATRYYWGNDIDPRYANFSDRNDPTGASIGSLDDGQAITAPVGSYLPNALDLRDMAGNVWEWTCSEYDPNYSGAEQRCSTRRSNEGQRVVRGGSWNTGAGELRSARRLPRKPGYQDAMTGFRVVMEE